MNDQQQRKQADQELRYRAIVLGEKAAAAILHEQVLGQLFCHQSLNEAIEKPKEKKHDYTDVMGS